MWDFYDRGGRLSARPPPSSIINVEVICSDKLEHRDRVENRPPSVPGLRKPTWKDVLIRDYHPWNQEVYRLDTSGKSVENSLMELVSALKAKGIDP